MTTRKPPNPGPDPASEIRDVPDPPQFLSTGAMQDPTLRTPGSEIPESIYAASDAEPFDIRNTLPPVALPLTRDNPAVSYLIAILLLAIIAATAIYLYRDRHRPAQDAPAPAVRSSRTIGLHTASSDKS